MEKVGNYLKEYLAKPGYKSKHGSTKCWGWLEWRSHGLPTSIRANVVVFVCLCVPHKHLRIAARAVGWKSSTYVRLPFFLSFFLSLCPFIRPSVSPSVHLSFFPSMTSPSSLAPFSVSLIYIFLVFFLGSHVIGLFSMCSNVHTTACVQLLDFFYYQIFLPTCTWNIWFQISNYLKDFSWEINGPKLARPCGKKKFLKH
jgi:hypothetical protein